MDVKSSNLYPGDIVIIEKNTKLTCDMILL